jgi:hypothetical protein
MSEVVDILSMILKHESYWLKDKIASLKGKKVVLFPAGAAAQQYYYTLKNEFGIEIEFFIDNNPDLEGKTVCGKIIKARPWETCPDFAQEYTILISVAYKYYFQIAQQLENAGISSYICVNACQSYEQNWAREYYSPKLLSLPDEELRMSVRYKNSWLIEKVKSFQNKKIVLFPSGVTAQLFCDMLKKDFSREVEFFIDNNPTLEGKIVCNKPIKIMPWKFYPNFAQEYAVLIPTSVTYYFQIAQQLEGANISSYMYADLFCAFQP